MDSMDLEVYEEWKSKVAVSDGLPKGDFRDDVVGFTKFIAHLFSSQSQYSKYTHRRLCGLFAQLL